MVLYTLYTLISTFIYIEIKYQKYYDLLISCLALNYLENTSFEKNGLIVVFLNMNQEFILIIVFTIQLITFYHTV